MARTTATAISRPGGLLLLPLVALAIAACGGGGSGKSFGWLKPGPAPAGWAVMRTPSGAAMGYPSGWRTLRGDAGTATAASIGAGGRIGGYLNLTPRQGDESLRNWAHFRVAHNREEGDPQVSTLESAGGLRFRAGRGSCVRDRYVTRVGTRYIEIACLIQGRRTTVVAVGAAPPEEWAATSPLLERALSSLTA